MNAERWTQIKSIFHDATELADCERATYVRSRCGGDETLAKEIEALLAAHDEASSFIETPPLDSIMAATEAESPEPMIGRRIGSYELTGEIGRGGMGTVYLAERADGLYRKRVAIKLARCDMGSDFVIRRFRNERKILAGLDHPNIASLLDGGATEDGVPYFVMEYVDGKPIVQYCDDNAFPIRERLNLFRSVCSAVDYAHQRSIVHRDIKPSNILVGSDGLPKLLDFGIAKLLEPELSPDAADSTSTALRLMTPEYASPEQVRGDPVTPASDVYSLGVLLYQLLTGRPPYRLKSRHPHEIARVICEQEPEKPSTAVTLLEEARNTDGKGMTTFTAKSVSKQRGGELTKLRKLLEGDLDSIVLTALHKKPEQRYASVEEFSEEIRRHLEGLPVIARKHMRRRFWITTREGDASPRGNLNPYSLLRSRRTLLFAALAVIVATGVIYSLLPRAPHSGPSFEIKRVAVLPLKSLDPAAEKDQSLGLKIADALIQRLGRLDKIVVRPTRAVQGYEGRTLDTLEAGRELQVDVVLDGSFQRADKRLRLRVQLLRVSDGQQLWASTFDERSTDPFFLEDALSEAAAQALLPHLAREEREIVARHYTENAEANRLYIEGRYYWNKRTEQGFQKAIEYFNQAIDKDPGYALAYAGLADCYALLSVWGGQPPNDALSRAETAAAKATELDNTLSEAHTSLAFAKWIYDRDWAGAEREFQEAIKLRPGYPTAHHWYSYFLAAMGRFDEAITQIKQARDLDELSASINTDVGEIYCWARRYDQALEQLQEVLKSEPNFPPARSILGMTYIKLGRLSEGVAELEAARHLDAGPRVTAALGCAYGLAGRKGAAQRMNDELKRMSRERYVSPFSRALICVGLGKRDEAFALLDDTYNEHSDSIVILGVYPLVDNFR